MLYTDDTPDRPTADLAAVRVYVADRLERLYPIDYHVYRRRWHDRGSRQAPGALLSFLEWRPLVQELTERVTVAAMVGKADPPVGELQRVLLVSGESDSKPAEQPETSS